MEELLRQLGIDAEPVKGENGIPMNMEDTFQN